ncbi:AAA family ATPase [Nocardiopsis sediminis]|uniref:AAA family ATPase n=1 Tax=Nocardiopsis sediminis TaxID=1778267 RepID=A0ABV8FWZ6_9ACTN
MPQYPHTPEDTDPEGRGEPRFPRPPEGTADTDRRVVITGGPGSGKTTLVDALRRAGFATSPEAGRAIIRAQSAIGGLALPWTDPGLFAEAMLCWELRSHEAAGTSHGPVIFDRGLPDIVGYLRLEGREVPAHVDAAARAFRYRAQVFIAPPWPAIYRADTERRQTPEIARRTYEAMAAAYTDHGYELIELPRAPVAERVRFVVDHIGGSGAVGRPG